MIYCVSTLLQEGKGGISTALTGFRETAVFKQYGINFVTSHSDSQKGKDFARAFMHLGRHVGGDDIVWLHCGNWFSILRKLVLAVVVKIKGGKVVFHFHSQEMDSYLKHAVLHYFIRQLCRFSDGIVVLTPWWKKRFVNAIPRIVDKILVLPNPIDESLINAEVSSKQWKGNNDYIHLLAMSRLVPGKGFEESIRVLSLLPEQYRLTIAGDGPLLEALQILSMSLGVNHRTKFVGWINYEQKKSLFVEHQIFLLPSRYDSFGMGFVEAMAYGLPVVALNFQATPDVVINNQTGILCEPDNLQELAAAVISCFERLDVMAPACRKHVLAAFNNEKIACVALNFFEKL
jgi:glycosyltransferase involved in cell wall biosynthesis